MEKLAQPGVATFPVSSDVPVGEALSVAFEPITLYRPLKLFGSAMGLEVGAATPPDPDFLVYLIEGAGHQRLVRSAAATHYKNFENLVRGRNRATETTKRILLAKLGLDEATLALLVHGRQDGPLVPAYLGLFTALEGLFLRIFGSATVGRAKCPCCGGDLLDDTDSWWKEQPLQLQPGAYRFVDRLLKAALGAALLMTVLGQDRSIDLVCLRDLAAPHTHPIGNWIDMVRLARGMSHDWELTTGQGDAGHSFGPVSDGRMRKWRSGQGLLPMPVALAMMTGTAAPQRLKHALLAARTLALAIDIVQATAELPDALARRPAQEAVAARLAQLGHHLRIASRL